MTYQEIVEKWNEQADGANQWDDLSEDEKIEFAFKVGENKPEVQITPENIRIILGAAGFKVDNKSDAEVMVIISSHLREFAAMREAVRGVLVFAKNFGHEA